MGKVRRMVAAHVPMEDSTDVLPHLRISPRFRRTRLNNPSLLEVESSLVCPTELHSISLSSFADKAKEGSLLAPHRTEEKDPWQRGENAATSLGTLCSSTTVGTPYWRSRLN